MRNHRKLNAFQLADALVLEIYRATIDFPKHEMFGLTSQMRRAAVSITSNIVEGCGRHTEADYLRFLDMAYASSCELQYQITLAARLGFLSEKQNESIESACIKASKVLGTLIQSYRRQG